MSNIDVARSLARSGLPVFPCQIEGLDAEGNPLHKKPWPGVMWAARASARLSDVENLWSRCPQAAPSIKLAGTPYFVIDCDAPKLDGQMHGIDWFRSICAEHDFDLDRIPIVQTPSGGWHCYFRRPVGTKIGNSRGSLPPKATCGVDIRGAGGYVVAPGAQIDIGSYELLDGPELTAASEPPAWLIDLLTSKRADAVVAHVPVVQSPVGSREEAYAAAALDDECRTLAGTPPGARNNQLNDSAFKIGTMVGAGWLPQSQARGALIGAVTGWKDAKKTIGTLERALAAGMAKPRERLEPGEADTARDRREDLARQLDEIVNFDPETGEVIEEPLQDFHDDDLRPPGLVGEIADWIEATSPRPVRLFAVGAALAVVGALVARQVYTGQPRTGTHLYMLMIAGTGGGKDRPQEAIGQILAAAGRPQMVKGAFSSEASLGLHLGRQPAQVQVIDEIAKVLRKINNNKSSNSEASMLEAYCTIWGRNSGDYRTDATTMREGEAIKRPWISVVGATTPTSLREQLKSRNVSNGFLNRFLMLPRHVRAEWREDIASADEVPSSIVERCQSLIAFDDDNHKFPQSALYAASDALPAMVVINTTPGADELLRSARDRQEEFLRQADEDPLLEVWSRSAEMIKRVALVVACGRHAQSMIACRITADDVAWADRLVSWSMASFVEELRQHMADTQHQADMLFVLGVIRKARTITKSELYHRLKGRFDKRNMDGILEILKIGGSIAEAKGEKPPRGFAPVVFRYLKG